MVPRVTLFAGQTQSGKSTLALWLAINEWPRVIVLDSARSKVFDRISSGGHFATALQLIQWMRTRGSELSRWCVALRSKNPQDYALILRASEYFRGILIVCDETHKLCRLPGVREPLELVALTGAHYGNGVGVSLYMVTQRATGVPINVRSQAERVISFKQREPSDLKWLAESCGEEFSERVSQLGEHDYITWPPTAEERERYGSLNKENARNRRSDSGGSLGSGASSAEAKEVRSGSDANTDANADANASTLTDPNANTGSDTKAGDDHNGAMT